MTKISLLLWGFLGPRNGVSYLLSPRVSPSAAEIHGFGGKTFWWRLVMFFKLCFRDFLSLSVEFTRVCFSLTGQVSFFSVVVTASLVHELVCSDLRHGMRHDSRKHEVSIHTRKC